MSQPPGRFAQALDDAVQSLAGHSPETKLLIWSPVV